MPKSKRANSKAKDLRVRKLSQAQAKSVRGGGSLLLPAVQKIRGVSPGSQACDGSSKDPA